MSDDFDEDAGIGHNSVDPTTQAQLRQYIERIERLNQEIADIQDDRKDVFTEAKAVGFDTKAMRRIIRDRKKDKQVREEEEAIYETYAIALGLI